MTAEAALQTFEQARPLLDTIEDILESLMCRAGWPGGAR